MSINNSTILDRIRLEGTNDYQQRIPAASQSGVRKTIQALNKPMNNKLFNEFVDNLITLIGTQYINSKAWENPFAEFKRLDVQQMKTVQEMGFQLMEAKGFDHESQELFLVEHPEIKLAYHSMNRQDKYKITLNSEMLQNAFLSPTGLSDFLGGALTAQLNSDAYDEYQMMKNLIKEADEQDTFFNVQIADLTAPGATDLEIKYFIESVRAYVGKLKFLSGQYNKYGIPTFSMPEGLVLFVTPELNAKIDVNVLAAAFNVSYAEMTTRVVIIDEFPVDNIQALLVDEDWFKVGDSKFETTTWFNPETLNTQYYLHHWSTISFSPFMNAIKFTTDAGTDIPVVTTDPADTLTLTSVKKGTSTASTSINLVDEFEMIPSLVVTNTPSNPNLITNFRPAVIEVINIARPDGVNPDIIIPLEIETYVDRMNILHLQDNVQVGDKITVMAETTYTDGTGATITTPTAELELTVA